MAPSGSGKKHMVDTILTTHRDIYFAKTYTSRSIRQGAEENPLYSFVTREAFEEMIQDDEFIEWAEFSGNLYGTPKSEIINPLQAGKVVFKEMELQGVEQIRKNIPKDHLTVVYIDAGDWEELKERITKRAEISEAELELRRNRFLHEQQAQPEADVTIRNRNGELEVAMQRMEALVRGIVDSLK
jgi:guanylate kinase